MLDMLVSICQDDELYAPPGSRVDVDPSRLCITFDKLLTGTPFVQRVRDMLSWLEDQYGVPVDMEFACDGQNFHLLQCRTQSQSRASAPVTIPEDIPSDDIIFNAR